MKIRYGIATLLMFIYLFTSHVMIKNIEDKSFTNFLSSPYSSAEYYQIPNSNYVILPSIYLTQKYVSLMAGCIYFPLGVGGNCHMEFAKYLYKTGQIKANVTLTPHSTYFGAFGELGILGLLCIVYLYKELLSYSKQIMNFDLGYRWIYGAVLFIIISGLTIDNMNLRHQWILISVLFLIRERPIAQIEE